MRDWIAWRIANFALGWIATPRYRQQIDTLIRLGVGEVEKAPRRV